MMPQRDIPVALFGGAFDPPHLGHRAVAVYLAQLPQFDTVWVLPSFKHPFGKAMAPFTERLAMAEIAFHSIPKVKVSPIEREVGSGYTADVLDYLKAQLPTHRFTLALGTDALQELGQWKRGEWLREQVPILEIPRAGWTESPFADLKSRDIRDAIANGRNASAGVGPELMDYICKQRLYGAPPLPNPLPRGERELASKSERSS